MFAPDSVTRLIHEDPVFAVAGLRALLLQALHPRAMAAVAAHGGFEADPWGRLTRTTEFVATMTWGTVDEAGRAAARVRGIHRKLRGTDPFTGEEYRLDQPDLLLWVHCCEVGSFVDLARRVGLVDRDGAAAYLQEQVRPAVMVGVREADVPRDLRQLDEYFRTVRPQLALLPEAAAGARALAVPPMPGWVQWLTPARVAWGGLTGLALSTLPRWARRMYRLPGLPTTDLVATTTVRTLRTVALTVPASVREGPALRAAREREAA
ncbi:DUF2236 domain-containing protein [Nakamurella sp. YIM 132087]|uniref:DUF2236 domain-containing protein n=2 Tax=Nakamurella alba TaxID=2665158 RepID=A0A7K1FTC6_9ACTN|nr:DUF2236 domain-containing protein [Nakamurella alba]